MRWARYKVVHHPAVLACCSRDVLHFLHTVLTPEERTNLWVRISGRIPEANNKLGDTERVAIVTNLLR